jgi:predicted HAD superfamily hydrolase
MENLTNDIVSVNDFYKNRSLSDKVKYKKVFGLYLDCCEKTIDQKEQQKCRI